MNPVNFFINLTIFNRASPVDVAHEGVMPWTLVQLASTVAQNPPHCPSHTVGITSFDMVRLSHASLFGVTGQPKGPVPLSFSSLFLSSSSSFTLWRLH
jgi:hypothetical protein